ncbi:MAG: GNAT family N-acetyltransferase [Calothrix sp. FI2-JRJ7]|jgi:predicted GNAT family acetyltransferase|nr:GNAT family N-acetyltransferase [Calothrix sp. FI2-JRJ7]
MVTYKSDLGNINWGEMKATLKEDAFDNGRSPQQLKNSFENSYATCIAYIDNRIVGTARVLSDGVCNAYIVDVWTFTPYRRQGIASKMISLLLDKLSGQHVCLFTEDAVDFYEKLGFTEGDTYMEKVIGKWLINYS